MARPGVEMGYAPYELDEWDETDMWVDTGVDDMWEPIEATCDVENPEVCESCQ